MNKQGENGISYTDYTWNPTGGCLHECQWRMPDGNIARCYAKDSSISVCRQTKGKLYDKGFECHYWYPERLKQPLSVKKPSHIFSGSMADMFGHWVPDENIIQVLDVIREAHWHTFQVLTKNPKRLAKFANLFPKNIHAGVSLPPSFMYGKELSIKQRNALWMTAIESMCRVQLDYSVKIWASMEPLSFDPIFYNQVGMDWWNGFDWLVIGAASDGRVISQPDPKHVRAVLGYADRWEIPVWMKGNLYWPERRQERLGDQREKEPVQLNMF